LFMMETMRSNSVFSLTGDAKPMDRVELSYQSCVFSSTS